MWSPETLNSIAKEDPKNQERKEQLEQEQQESTDLTNLLVNVVVATSILG